MKLSRRLDDAFYAFVFGHTRRDMVRADIRAGQIAMFRICRKHWDDVQLRWHKLPSETPSGFVADIVDAVRKAVDSRLAHAFANSRLQFWRMVRDGTISAELVDPGVGNAGRRIDRGLISGDEFGGEPVAQNDEAFVHDLLNSKLRFGAEDGHHGLQVKEPAIQALFGGRVE